MEKGILCWIYVNKDFGDCSNNGISAKKTKVVVLNNPEFPDVQVPEIFEPTEDAPAAVGDTLRVRLRRSSRTARRLRQGRHPTA